MESNLTDHKVQQCNSLVDQLEWDQTGVYGSDEMNTKQVNHNEVRKSDINKPVVIDWNKIWPTDMIWYWDLKDLIRVSDTLRQ